VRGDQHITRLEITTYGFVLVLILLGLVLSYANHDYFQNTYVTEDGLIEWLATIGFAAGSVVCFRRVLRLTGKRPIPFIGVTAMLGLMFLFCAGEEISWGQRILGVESTEWFRANNAQEEMNFHNITIGDVKLNKLIFSKGVAVGMAVYFLVLIPLYGTKSAWARRVDALAIPVAKLHQLIACAGMLLLTQVLVQSSKRGELAEFGGAFLFVVIVAWPANAKVFDPATASPDHDV